MLNCKIPLFILVFSWLTGCKPPSFSFKENEQINTSFFKNIPELAGYKDLKLDSVNVYRARLEEQIVDRNDVSEYKLINSQSKKSNAVKFPVQANYQHLYLFVLHSSPEKNICIFLSTGFNADDSCTGIGPAYLGHIRSEQINFIREIKIRKGEGGIYRFEKGGAHSNTVMHFYLDKNSVVAQHSGFRVEQIIRNVPNKVSGLKPVIFNIRNIFNDPDALLFSYETTFR